MKNWLSLFRRKPSPYHVLTAGEVVDILSRFPANAAVVMANGMPLCSRHNGTWHRPGLEADETGAVVKTSWQ